MIGIIGAMDEEVAQIVEVMQVERKENKACMTFMAGKLNGKDVVVVRSGIGKVNAAICTQILGRSVSGGCSDQYRYCRFS